MRRFHRFYAGIAILWLAGATFCACEQDTGGAGTTGTSTLICPTTADCHEILFLGRLNDDCLHQYCCPELAACHDAAKCYYCTGWDPSAPECVNDPEKPIADAFLACYDKYCWHRSDGGLGYGGAGGSGGAGSTSSSGGG